VVVIVRLLLKWLIIALAIALTAELFTGIEITGGFGSTLWVALIFGLVNAIIGPIFRFLAIPLMVITLGLFALVVNALLFLITDAISSNLEIDGFWPAVGGALVIALVDGMLELLIDAGD